MKRVINFLDSSASSNLELLACNFHSVHMPCVCAVGTAPIKKGSPWLALGDHLVVQASRDLSSKDLVLIVQTLKASSLHCHDVLCKASIVMVILASMCKKLVLEVDSRAFFCIIF